MGLRTNGKITAVIHIKPFMLSLSKHVANF